MMIREQQIAKVIHDAGFEEGVRLAANHHLPYLGPEFEKRKP